MRARTLGQLRRWWLLSILLAGAASLVSCSKNGKLPVYPTKGKILIDGKPAKDAFIQFYPRDGIGTGAPCPYGQTDENGTFALSTHVSGDGAPAGEYDVTITWPARFSIMTNSWEGDKLKGRYNDRSKPSFQVTVEKKPQELPPFELKSSSPEK
jgi:hypothetical protein